MENREPRRIVSPGAIQIAKEKGRYERWVHRMAAPNILVERTTNSFTNKGDRVMNGGIALCFQNHVIYLDKQDPDYKVCRDALMATRAYKVGRLVCYDAMTDKQKRMLDPEFLGVNRKTNLKRFGIDSERQLQAVLDFADVKGEGANEELVKENAELKRQLAEAKKGKGGGKGKAAPGETVEKDPEMPAVPPAETDED